MAEDIVKVTELPKVEALTDEDTLLLIRQKEEEQECYQIKGNQFKGQDGANGKSAYEVAIEQGFTGTYWEWTEQIKAITEFDTKAALAFKGIAGNDANKALTSGIYPNVTTNVPINGETFTIQTLRTTTAVYNQYLSTQIALGTTGTAIGKVYIRKNSQKSGSYTFGDWVDLSANVSTGSVTYESLSSDALNGIQDYIVDNGVPSEQVSTTEIENMFNS